MTWGQISVWTKVACTILLVALAGWFGSSLLERQWREQTADQLQSTLQIGVTATQLWIKEQYDAIQCWAQQPAVRKIACRLLKKLHEERWTPNQLRDTREVDELRTILGTVCVSHDYLDVLIIDRSGLLLAAAMDDGAIGTELDVAQQDFIASAFTGHLAVSFQRPSHGPAALYIASPLHNETDEIVAVLLFKLSPSSRYSQILESSRSGMTGETYAFDKQGRMLSESRFVDQLPRIGLASDKTDAAIELRDPGGNLLDGYQPLLPRERLPLTRMAASAVSGSKDFSVDSYRDYRGVPVVGAWRWFADYGFGITYEVDLAEASRSLNEVRAVLLSILGLLIVAIGIGGWSHARGHRLHHDRQQAELKLVESETRSHQILNTALDAVITMDSRGAIVSWNEQAHAMFGWSVSEVLGRPLADTIIPLRYREAHQQGLSRFLTTGEGPLLHRRIEIEALHRDGHELPVQLIITAVQNTAEVNFSAFLRDLTEIKQAEKDANHQLAELAHVGRLSTVGKMAAILAHEISQPLAAAAHYASGCVRVARSDEGVSQEELLSWMEKTAAQTERATAIVQRLGNFVKKGNHVRCAVDINDAIRSAVALAAPNARTTSMTVCLELDESLPQVVADRIQIEQVIMNLVHNAQDAMQHLPEALRVLILRSHCPSPGTIEISVSDRGGGITPHDLPHIFEPYFTTKPAGLGLGLSICRSIIAQHSGRLWAESNAANGTTFHLSLPRLAAEAA